MNWILANQLKSKNIETCLEAGKKIAKQQTDAVFRDMKKILESNSKELRSGGVFLAVALKAHSGRKIINALLTDKDIQVRIATLENLRELNATDYGADIYLSFEDVHPEVVIEGILTSIALNGDGCAQKLSELLSHENTDVRKKAYILGTDFWNYEHLDSLKKCLSQADSSYSDELSLLISKIESRSQSLAKALERGSGKGNGGIVDQPRFRSAQSRVNSNNKSQSDEETESISNDSETLDNTNFEDLDGFVGYVKEVELQDILQMVCVNRRSQSYEITTPHGMSKIDVFEGEIVHASFGDDVGQDALFQILASTKGKFKEVEYKAPEMRTIHAPWEFLLLESARIQDESETFPFKLEDI